MDILLEENLVGPKMFSLQIREKIEGKAGPAFERQKCPCESVCDFCCFLVFSSAAFYLFIYLFFINIFLLLLRCYGFQLFYFIF